MTLELGWPISIDTAAERLGSPKGSVVVVFASMKAWLTGYVRTDAAVKCVDPFTASMKYLDHMRARGWMATEISQTARDDGNHVISLTLERQAK